MKQGIFFGSWAAAWVAAMSLQWGGAARAQTAEAPEPPVTIRSIQRDGTNLVIEVEFPAAAKRVVLESRTRAERGAWKPVAVQYVPTPAGSPASETPRRLSFRVPMSAKMEVLRVRMDRTTDLPESFYQGTDSFGTAGGPTSAAGPRAFTGFEDALSGGAPPPNREVVESDIWKLQGDTLYFYNQNRGLQVIDIGNPDAPVLRGTYERPGSGEQMYLIGSTHVVLLTSSYCYYGGGEQSQVVVVEVTGADPRPVAELPVSGHIVESRMVGSALYVVSSKYRVLEVPLQGGGVTQNWEWGNEVSSFDLSDPANPLAKHTAWANGYGQAVYATDRFLFIAGPNRNFDWNASAIRIFDISDPHGAMTEVATIETRGQVQDKFKMQLLGDVFTCVTMDWSTVESRVQTFSLADPKAPRRLANLLIKQGEQLFATRFAGRLLYAVTFLRIDPLWIIDLSDPSAPRKVSELELPGWSTYIHPLGDRLLTIGIDVDQTWRTSLQLFDVSDPARPALLSRELIGDKWSSTEANYNEKALTVLPDHHLVLLPISLSDHHGSKQGIQIVDLERDRLRPRGFIDQDFYVRRATLHRDRVVSISAEELLAVDVTDRDQPRITSRTELSWPVDQVILAGEHLVEFSAPYGQAPRAHVVSAAEPGRILNRLTLEDLNLVGVTARDRKLYVLQGRPETDIWPTVWDPSRPGPIGTVEGRLVLTIFDLSDLPALKVVGRVEKRHHLRWLDLSRALWPKSDVLVWGPGNSGAWHPWLRWELGTAGPEGVFDAAVVGVRAAPIWWGYGGGSLFIACQVADPTQPAFASEVDVSKNKDRWWSPSRPFQVGTLVYVSHQTSEYDPDFQPPPLTTSWWDGKQWVTQASQPPKGMWITKHFLHVIDFADETEPVLRNPVSLPGTLIGVASGGSLLFTQGYTHSDANWWDYTETIAASAYDGVAARLVTQMPLPNQWPRASTAFNGRVFLGRPGETSNDGKTTSKPALEVWVVSPEGKFVQQARLDLDIGAEGLEELRGMLAMRAGGRLSFYDVTTPTALRELGRSTTCYWSDLGRADGAIDRGVWLPLGSMGVMKVEFSGAP